MAKIDVSIGLTLTLKGRLDGSTDYEFIRPEIHIKDIDTDSDLSVREQLKIAKKAIKPTWSLISKALETMLEQEFGQNED